VVAATLGFIQEGKLMIEGFTGCFFKPDTITVFFNGQHKIYSLNIPANNFRY
jgi:hypothetical protein